MAKSQAFHGLFFSSNCFHNTGYSITCKQPPMASNEAGNEADSSSREDDGPQPLLSNEPIIRQPESSSESTDKPFGSLRSKDPSDAKPESIPEGAPQPLISREPVEDEYPGHVEFDPDGFSTYCQREGPIFGRSVDVEVNLELVSKVTRTPQRPIHRVESIEAKIELQDQLHQMTMHELLTTKNQIKELEEVQHVRQTDMAEFKTDVNVKMADLEAKLDRYITLADKQEKERVRLATENEELKDLVDTAREQAERERSNLPNVIVKLEQKLAEVEKEMKNTNEKFKKSDREKERLRKKSESLEEEKAVQDVRLQNQQWILRKFEKRCEELEVTNRRLQQENSHIKETIFRRQRQRHSNSSSSNQVSSSAEATAAKPSSAGKTDITLECFSCHSGYLPSTNGPNDCRFHPLPGMHFREWRLWPIAEGNCSETDMKKLYWACCDKLCYGRPVGCCVGRHHQQWEMDITMKTVLLSKENLDWYQ